jgi:hypothetical protein
MQCWITKLVPWVKGSRPTEIKFKFPVVYPVAGSALGCPF